MRHFLKFIALPLKTKLIYAEAFFILGISRLLIIVMKFKHIAKYLGKANHETINSDEGINLIKVRQVSLAINTMCKYTPWKSKCLVQALSAKIMLKRRKQKSTVYFGFGKEDGKMIAHAWVRCGTIYVTGGDGSRDFAITGKFS